MTKNIKKIIIATGGTGGHVFQPTVWQNILMKKKKSK